MTYDFSNNIILRGTEALQFSFKTARRNPEVHEQQLRDTILYLYPRSANRTCI